MRIVERDSSSRKVSNDQDANLLLVVLLASLAGWVDALSFVHWNGLFVSFMSGNSTKLAVAASFDWTRAAEPALAIFVFVVGVIGGELIEIIGKRWGRALVLAMESTLIWLAAAGEYSGQREPVVASLLCAAMGFQNASVHHADGIGVALTYVTGTLVSIGRSLARAVCRQGPWRAAVPYLLLWIGLVGGGLGGGAAARMFEPAAMVVAAGTASIFAIWVAARVALVPPT